MSKVSTGNITHDATVARSEGILQAAVNTPGVTVATVRTAMTTHYRACLSSAIANNCGQTTFLYALREIGAGGG